MFFYYKYITTKHMEVLFFEYKKATSVHIFVHYFKRLFGFQLICFFFISPFSRVVLPVSVEEVSVIIINFVIILSKY